MDEGTRQTVRDIGAWASFVALSMPGRRIYENALQRAADCHLLLMRLSDVTGRDIGELTVAFREWLEGETCGALQGLNVALAMVLRGEDCPF